MTQDKPIAPFDWFANQFTSARREEFIEKIYPHIKSYFKTGNRVVDLCCGAGSITIFLEEQGVNITGIDLAPFLITLAREEAARRGANATFVQANILSYHLGKDIYDLAVCFGNAICDFPPQSFPSFRDQVFNALKPWGYFLLEYIDGLRRVASMSEPMEVVEQGYDSQIIRRFKGYDPATSAFTMEFKRLSTGEIYEGKEYVYTAPMIQLLMGVKFNLIQSIKLDHSFLDVYIRQ